jgi:hypothetical protein
LFVRSLHLFQEPVELCLRFVCLRPRAERLLLESNDFLAFCDRDFVLAGRPLTS